MKTMLHALCTYSRFTLLALLLTARVLPSTAQTVDYGKSYINVTKGTSGGTIETGDVLEFRTTFVVRTSYVDSCAYFDTVKTGMSYVTGSLAILTNEGKVYKSFTDAAGDDCGSYNAGVIRINLGFNSTDAPATATLRGRIRNTHKPSFYSNTCIMVISYRVTVTAALNTVINTGGGSITYKPSSSSIQTINMPYNNSMVFTNFGICSNTIGANALGAESNGTFGFGKPRNRGTSVSVPANYTYNVFAASSPQDYYYGITNNTCAANFTTVNTWAIPDNTVPTHRVHKVWDIIGDHTNAVSPTAGNPPADTVNSNTGGYMLVVNASYRIDSAFSHTISGLCPNTYYELSAWFRNICSKCGCDSNGRGATATSGALPYIPTAAGDSSGVYPNLTIRVDGIDYYTTGNMLYTGQWIKKGFTYVTGPSQTSLTMTIRNNAPGGGGNDWAIDDISLATCTPTLNLVPSGGVNICFGNQVDMYTTVSCFSPNYIYWIWERSTDGGATWTNTGVSGTGSPALVSGSWTYTATYPSFLATAAYHNNMFRVRVASTAANLTNANCSFTASNTIIVMVNNCLSPLKTQLVSFDGALKNNLPYIKWTSNNEENGTRYELLRSDDGTAYYPVCELKGNADANGQGTYSYTDNKALTGMTFYKLRVINGAISFYSKVIVLNGETELAIRNLINPFSTQLSFTLVSPGNQPAIFSILDNLGRLVKQEKMLLTTGINKIQLQHLSSIEEGTYTLSVVTDGKVINRKVVKAGH